LGKIADRLKEGLLALRRTQNKKKKKTHNSILKGGSKITVGLPTYREKRKEARQQFLKKKLRE